MTTKAERGPSLAARALLATAGLALLVFACWSMYLLESFLSGALDRPHGASEDGGAWTTSDVAISAAIALPATAIVASAIAFGGNVIWRAIAGTGLRSRSILIGVAALVSAEALVIVIVQLSGG